MNDKLAGLSPAKRALLEKMLKQRAEAVDPREAAIPKRPLGEAPPLSFNQEILWVLDKLMPGGTAYNVPRATRFVGQLDAGALKAALDTIVARHEAIRTTYPEVDGTPTQAIAAPRPVDLRTTDLRHLPPAEREAEAQRLLVHGARESFDLTRDLMLRADLFRLDETDHILLLVTHHIASDGWSKALLLRELTELYDAFARGLPSPLPEVPLQYADFSVWQRKLYQGDVLDKQIAYWKKTLAGIPAMMDLPLARPRPPVQSYRGLRQSLLIPRPVVDALRALAQKEGATLFMVLLAAFQALLHRYTGQDDIVVGTPIAGRNRKDIEGIVGFFTNTLVMRTDCSKGPSFRALVARVREVALGAYDHQDLPFEKLVMELKPERALSHAPLFQVMFVLQNNPQAERQPQGLTVTPLKVERGNAKFDLLLSLTEHPEGLTGSLEYSTDLFDAATMTRLRGHFRAMVDAVVRDPDRSIDEVDILSDAERHQILVEWNRTTADYSHDRCLHELLEAQAARTPDAVAVGADDGELTYRALNERANRLAHFLRRRGVGPETTVGISGERSLDMVVGLVGILKAGGACLPLDPTYPRERLVLMIEEAAPTVLLTQERFAAALQLGAEVICLDSGLPAIAAESAENPASGVTPDNLAYVLFTSGSTGRPKGVLLPHRGLVNTCCSVAEHYGYRATDRVLQFASWSFDAHIEELFPTWMIGATVVLRNDDMISSGTRFLRAIDERAITVLDLPTAYWHEWVRELSATGDALPERVHALIVGGEQASTVAYAAWLEIPGARRVRWINTVAPTECSIVSTVYVGDPSVTEPLAELPVGRPIGNMTSYVLDARQKPVPIGVAGEWVIGGPGVARGYLNRPDQTRAAFIDDPFGEEAGDKGATGGGGAARRVYRTGDRARYLPDGNIVLMGRLDQQVKIRGYRVELGEIEAMLGQHPAVAQCVVVARKTRPSGNVS